MRISNALKVSETVSQEVHHRNGAFDSYEVTGVDCRILEDENILYYFTSNKNEIIY